MGTQIHYTEEEIKSIHDKFYARMLKNQKDHLELVDDYGVGHCLRHNNLMDERFIAMVSRLDNQNETVKFFRYKGAVN